MNRLVKLFEDNKPNTEMSAEEMRVMMGILLSKEPAFKTPIDELDKDSEIYESFRPLLEGFQLQVFSMKLKQLTTLRISLGAFIMLSQHFKSAGDAVMYAFYLCHKLPINTFVDASTVTSKLFPFGFFSNEQLNEMWDKQKVKFDDGLDECTCIGAPDNLLDYVEFWEK